MVAQGVAAVGPIIHESGQHQAGEEPAGVDLDPAQKIDTENGPALRIQGQFFLVHVGQQPAPEIRQHGSPALPHPQGLEIGIRRLQDAQHTLEGGFGKAEGGAEIIGEKAVPVLGSPHHRLGQKIGQGAGPGREVLAHEEVEIQGHQPLEKGAIPRHAQGAGPLPAAASVAAAPVAAPEAAPEAAPTGIPAAVPLDLSPGSPLPADLIQQGIHPAHAGLPADPPPAHVPLRLGYSPVSSSLVQLLNSALVKFSASKTSRSSAVSPMPT